jgi:hypothetical protein
MDKFIPFILARLVEKSTVTTIATLIAGVAGISLSPEHTDKIVTAVVGVVSAIAIFWGEDKKPE